jgi:hypothetical protein
MTYSIVCEEGIVRVRHTGSLTITEVTNSRQEAGRVLQERGVRKVLVDLREGRLAQTTVDMFDFGTSYGQVFPFGTKIAVVVISGRTGSADDAVFAETVARNAGARLRMFEDMEEAESWLTAGGNPGGTADDPLHLSSIQP